MRLGLMIVALAAGPAAATTAPTPAPVQVMIVGDYHMSNPGRDIVNVKAEDVLAPARQAQIAAVTRALARFHPTKVAAEWDADMVAERWPKYVAGTLPPSRNEVVQLGFRLAKAAGAKMYGVDVEGEFPYDAVQTWAAAHGLTPLLDQQQAIVERHVAEEQAVITRDGAAAGLRWINEPSRIAAGNDFYRTTLRIGGGATQPGADLLTAWYRRNFLICANLVQLAAPGDRMVVFYGSGHALLLRQCIAETPGFQLVEPNAWLPR